MEEHCRYKSMHFGNAACFASNILLVVRIVMLTSNSGFKDARQRGNTIESNMIPHDLARDSCPLVFSFASRSVFLESSSLLGLWVPQVKLTASTRLPILSK